MKSFIPIIISLTCAVGLRASVQPQSAQNAPPLDPKNVDPSVKPGDDFFSYANGAWIKRTEIPPEYSRWGAFNELIERNNDSLHTIAEKTSQTSVDPKLAPETQKVGDYYASGMDEKAIEAARTQPLAEEFQKIDSIKDPQDVLKEIAHLHSIGINAFFNFGAGPDAKDSTHDIAQAVQGGLGMPDRDYYITMRDITRIRQIMEDTEIRLDQNDAISIRLWSTQLQQDGAHVVLKDKQDPPPLGSALSPEIFVLCIQTKFQCDCFQELGSDFVSIDATHNTTQYVGLQLFTIIVRDLWGHGTLCGVFPLLETHFFFHWQVFLSCG